MSRPIYDAYDLPRPCLTCQTYRDARGFCECDPVGVVCCFCPVPHVISDGRGIVSWEAGRDDVLVSHGMCPDAEKAITLSAECFTENL